ncbi:MAG: hypothetical protein JO317_04660 [Verrucomicrobiae bacterium]|nr:hypothetical protein [Verrucomicrobiae bacterium]
MLDVQDESTRHRRESAGDGGAMDLTQMKLKLRDGKERTVLQSRRAVSDLEGNALGTAIVFRDLKEIEQMENQLIESGKISESGIMDAQIANEFDNVLTSLVILAIPLLGPFHAELGQNDGWRKGYKKASELTKDLTKNLAALTGMPMRSLA